MSAYVLRFTSRCDRMTVHATVQADYRTTSVEKGPCWKGVNIPIDWAWWTSVDATHSFVQIVTRGRSPKLHNLSQGPGVRNSHVSRFDLARGSSNVASGSLSASARATYHAS